MKKFFSSTFVNEELLEEERIYHPIKLEYYKIVNEEENKFGVNVVKKEYKKEGLKVENQRISYISDNEKKIEEILNTLERNKVTPTGLEDVLNDLIV